MPKHEWDLEEVDQEILKMRDNLKTIAEAFGHVRNITNLNAYTAAYLNNKSETNRQAIIQTATLLPEISQLAATVQTKIMSYKNAFGQIEQHCRMGRAATQQFADAFGTKQLEDIDPADTHLLSVKTESQTRIKFFFRAVIRSPDTKVFKVRAFSHWRDLTTEPRFWAHSGLEYIMHNKASMCIEALYNLNLQDRRVYSNCDLTNFSDPITSRWDWKPHPAKELVAPTVFKTPIDSNIYCLYSDIEMNGKREPCPPLDFQLPISQSFSTIGHDHKAVEVTIEGQPYQIPI